MENSSDLEKMKSDKKKIVADFIAVKKENQNLFFHYKRKKRKTIDCVKRISN